MVTHMKTTVEISDALMGAAREAAQERGITLRALIEEGLRRVLREQEKRPVFRLRRASFRGEGRIAGTDDWEQVRALIYRDAGE